ncbi:hypothetical protein TCAL_11311 [Tigriopus californicus]|uniref:Vesicle-fusing ATPase n=1 Tax=Tigriopus californicus TaxID=6832 RepID=A0A553NCT1_TIGCA|nr:vesicle-fusing ATPase 1-like [Tigriopus californicus]TRY63225.1 hypothetical protein TCAL_11311 [Tigriopus californicus]|eukprot:TCALIF_11311-PA protein Name:"Similar to comt Vesicle-fusing ATPase 1 (Drosophila melanogaster)" AED:0.01 eAED:0.01 QI:360/1/1/1/1/1/3/253/745
MVVMKVGKCPTETLSLTNRVVIHPQDAQSVCAGQKHAVVCPAPGQRFVYSLVEDGQITPGQLGFGLAQRKWSILSLNQDIDVVPHQFDTKRDYISAMVLYIDFYNKKKVSQEPYDTDAMAKEFLMQFHHQAFSVGQPFVFQFQNKALTSVVVGEIQTSDLSALKDGSTDVKPVKSNLGLSFPNTSIIFEKAEGSTIQLIGSSKGKVVRQSIINPDWDFSKMGIGGLDTEFNAIFRRAFASRVFPPEIMEQLGCKHVKGILLFGPPGTGKTLMARQIGQMLNAREPKIVNGPQILDKYVGESEANIRRLFADAEEEEKRMGPNSGLHIIIFDEIDAICKARGSVAGNSGVNDTVVNQLLSKIDGVDQLNNILIIGMTNRRDMIDDALLRPGRLEVSIEIGLPKEKGRTQILNIHTRKMKANGKMGKDVNLEEFATMTKNFSGAELEGLVRAAQSCALNRLVKASSKVEIDPDAAEKLVVSRADFMHAFENDVKPAFGASQEILDGFLARGILPWGNPVRDVLDDGALLIQQAASSDGPGLVSILLEGSPNAGKTALGAELAKMSGFPFVKICSPEDMVGYTESAKCMQIRKIFDDAYRSAQSCIIVDNVERLLDYGPIGPRYSNLTLQALLVLLKKNPPKGKRLLVVCTTSRREVLDQMEMLSAFTDVLHVSNLTKSEHFKVVLENSGVFSKSEMDKLLKKLAGYKISIGIKKVLGLLDMVKQMKQDKMIKFITKLEDEGFIVLNV